MSINLGESARTDNTRTPDVVEVTDKTTGQRLTPWGRIGADTGEVLTAEEAIVRAGLDWEVKLDPINRSRDNVQVPSRFALYRTDTNEDLSIVSDEYKVFQNREAFSFVDSVLGKIGGAHYETGGMTRGGRTVFLSARIPHDVLIAGEDAVHMYLLMRTSHDGSSRIKLFPTPVRIGCTNAINTALAGAVSSWGVTHTADVKAKLVDAQNALKISFNYMDKLKEFGETMAGIRCTSDDLRFQLKQVIREQPTRDAKIEQVISVFENVDNLANFRDTAWGAWNAVSEWTEHVRPNRSGMAAFERQITGDDVKLRNRLSERLLALA